MNRRILRVLSFAFALTACIFGFSACNNEIEHNHVYGEWTVIKPATCTETGERRQECACGDYRTEEIPKLDHRYEDMFCTVCGQLSPAVPVTGSLKYSEIEENGVITGYCVTGAGENEEYIRIPSEHNGKPVTAIGKNAFYYSESLKGVAVGDGVTVIGKNAFYNCENLKNVAVGDGVTLIGELAFADCYALETVTLGKSVKTIDEYAFSQCSALKTINFPSGLETIGECAFVSCESLDKADFSYGLKSIGDCAFGGCTSLASFILPDSVTEIGWGVIMFQQGGEGWFEVGDLSNCLTEVVISNSITEIPDFAFSKSNIKTAEIGKSVETIRYSSFYGCAMLESIVIPKSVKKIESYAFYQCSALESVFYAGTEEEWGKITVGKNGNDISVAPKYFYSETQPESEGNFWHYVNGVPTVW